MKKFFTNRVFWLLLIICCLTLLPFIGLSEYHTKGEPRESVVSYSMLATDNWTLPRNNGGEMAYKPPFFHWCVAAVSAIRGKVTEASSRLPSAIALIVMIMSTFAFYLRRKNTETAIVTALVAFTSFELHRAGANCRVDMVLTAATVCSLYLLFRWYEQGMKGIPLLAIILMGLGTLTKGPVGSLIPCLVTGIFLLLRRVNFFKVFFLMFAWGLLSLIPYALWFYFAWQQGGTEFLDLMYEENIGRMTSTMGYESCVEPWYYNFITVILGYIPWTLMLLISLFSLTWKKPVLQGKWLQITRWIRETNPTTLFSLCAVIVIFVFYCIPQSKRSVYLMPIYPFLAFFITRYMQWLTTTGKKAVHVFCGVLATLSIVLPICLFVVKTGIVPEDIFHGRHATVNIAMLHHLEDGGAWWQWPLIILPGILGCWYWVKRPQHAIVTALVLIIGLYLSLDGFYTPTVLNAKSIKGEIAAMEQVAPASKGVLYEYIEYGVKAKGDPVHFFEVNFYMGNRIESFHQQKPEKGFLLILKSDVERNFPEFQKEGYRFKQLYEEPKREMQIYEFTKESL